MEYSVSPECKKQTQQLYLQIQIDLNISHVKYMLTNSQVLERLRLQENVLKLIRIVGYLLKATVHTK